MGNTRILPGSGHARESCHETTPFLEPLNQALNDAVFSPLKGLQFGFSVTLTLAPPPLFLQLNPRSSLLKHQTAIKNGVSPFWLRLTALWPQNPPLASISTKQEWIDGQIARYGVRGMRWPLE
ncbi:hypothetical protein V6Z11_A07G109800 [Gossypium hirsutum]